MHAWAPRWRWRQPRPQNAPDRSRRLSRSGPMPRARTSRSANSSSPVANSNAREISQLGSRRPECSRCSSLRQRTSGVSRCARYRRRSSATSRRSRSSPPRAMPGHGQRSSRGVARTAAYAGNEQMRHPADRDKPSRRSRKRRRRPPTTCAPSAPPSRLSGSCAAPTTPKRSSAPFARRSSLPTSATSPSIPGSRWRTSAPSPAGTMKRASGSRLRAQCWTRKGGARCAPSSTTTKRSCTSAAAQDGDTARARPLLEAALTQFRDIGMTGWQRHAEELLANLPS